MPLTGIRGLGGSGKTTFVVYLLKECFEKLKVYSNFEIKLPNVKVVDAMELFELEETEEPIIAVWDEGYTEAENRDAMSDINRIKTYIPMQARKNNLSLIVIEQIDIMDIRFRQLENSWIYCYERPIYNRDFTPYKGDFYYAHIRGSKIKSRFTLRYNKAKKIFPLFETRKKIFPKDFEDMKRRAKLQNTNEKIRYIRNLAEEIKQKYKLEKITHDTVKYAMLEIGCLDYSLERYVYAVLKGTV